MVQTQARESIEGTVRVFRRKIDVGASNHCAAAPLHPVQDLQGQHSDEEMPAGARLLAHRYIRRPNRNAALRQRMQLRLLLGRLVGLALSVQELIPLRLQQGHVLLFLRSQLAADLPLRPLR